MRILRRAALAATVLLLTAGAGTLMYVLVMAGNLSVATTIELTIRQACHGVLLG